MEEYNRRFALAREVTGHGAETATVFPCPFCAARDFVRVRVVATEHDMGREAMCSRCGRSGKHLVARTKDGMSAEFVQTGGDPPPAWMTNPPRRV